MKELWAGLLFLTVCLLTSGWVEVRDWRSEFLAHFLSVGLVIVGWIAIWHPVELLLFERWPMTRDRGIYQSIRDMELDIRAIA